MLRLFFVLILILVFSTIMISYSYANHDDIIPSYIQNNTGWDREFFHEYDLFVVTDEFGKFVLPYKFDNNAKIDDVIVNFHIGKIPGDLMIILTSYDKGVYGFFIPAFVDNSVLIYDGLLVKGEEQNYDVSLFNTHTHYSVNDIADQIHFAFSSTVIDNKFFQKFILYDYVFPPLKQTQNGIESQDILCKEHLELILSPNDSPACVKLESISKLIERGWTK